MRFDQVRGQFRRIKEPHLRALHAVAATELAAMYQELGFANKAIEIWATALSSAPNDTARERIKAELARL